FIEGVPREKSTPEDHRATLQRLIDQELLREQLASGAPATIKPEELKQRMEEVRKLYPGADTEEGWKSTLARYGLNETELQSRLAQQVELANFIDSRLRPGIQIDSHSIEVYYQEQLLPQLKDSGEKVSLAEVAPKIKEVLTQKKMNDMLVAW